MALALSLASSGDPEAPRFFENGIRTMAARIGSSHPLVREACDAAAELGLAAAPCSRAGGGRVGDARPPVIVTPRAGPTGGSRPGLAPARTEVKLP